MQTLYSTKTKKKKKKKISKYDRLQCKIQNFKTSRKILKKNLGNFGFGIEVLNTNNKSTIFRRKKVICCY